jgi:hypothetical protein
MLKPVDPALFLIATRIDPLRERSRPGMPLEPTPRSFPFGSLPLGFKDHAFNAPTQPVALHVGAVSHHREVRLLRALSDPVLRPGTLLEIRAEPPLSAARRAGGVIRSGALVGAPGGTQTHSRRTGRKLGRLRYARQGLVRVPESNTKYGGRRGKTGVGAAPVIEPSISESWEIPKRKNSLPGCGFRLRPAVHRAAIFSRPGIAFGGLT